MEFCSPAAPPSSDLAPSLSPMPSTTVSNTSPTPASTTSNNIKSGVDVDIKELFVSSGLKGRQKVGIVVAVIIRF
ncbi:hypothetical protein F0562_012048 [Nyssa sinensis]|uniref:Uncharacterized protein n=1 Tax=Nyssa sinensis TaxID=561372 RepID=A0A5J4ZW75_9ASTE|nr:hypothetical protein F0562_012048 [Nyssa sinensis]